MLDAGFAVGSIVGVWPGNTLLGVRGREQVAACYAVYGPRTLLVLAAPALPGTVNEYALLPGDADGTPQRWRRLRAGLRIAPDTARVFAPANARAVADNAAYRQLLHSLLDARLTIRYRRVMTHPCHVTHRNTADSEPLLCAQRGHGTGCAPHAFQGRRLVFVARLGCCAA